MRLNGRRAIMAHFTQSSPRNYWAWQRVQQHYADLILRDPDSGQYFLETDPVIVAAERERGCRTLRELGGARNPVKSFYMLAGGVGVGVGGSRLKKKLV